MLKVELLIDLELTFMAENMSFCDTEVIFIFCCQALCSACFVLLFFRNPSDCMSLSRYDFKKVALRWSQCLGLYRPFCDVNANESTAYIY